MNTVRIRRSLSLVTALALAAACSADVGTVPSGLAPRAPDRTLTDFGSVFNVQLRTLPPNPILPPSPIYGWGNLQMRLGSLVDNSCVPPNPITPQPGSTLLSVCGRIFNEGGALYRGGGLYSLSPLGEGTVLVAAFSGALPPNPCRRYDIAGVVTVPDAIAADMILSPTSYQVLMDGDVAGAPTRIGARIDGSAWGSVGSRPETDPFFAEKVCDVAVTP